MGPTRVPTILLEGIGGFLCKNGYFYSENDKASYAYESLWCEQHVCYVSKLPEEPCQTHGSVLQTFHKQLT